MKDRKETHLLPGGAFLRWEGGFFESNAALNVAQSEGLGVRVQVVALGIALVLGGVPEHVGLVVGFVLLVGVGADALADKR